MGGQFERIVGLMKNALQKTIGNGFLTWEELEEVLMDAEVSLNDRPLSYVEEDVQYPLLTPNTMMFLQSNILPERDPDNIDDCQLRKRTRHLQKCKESLWKRWSTEYLTALRERHDLKHSGKSTTLKIGDIVIIKSDKESSKMALGYCSRTLSWSRWNHQCSATESGSELSGEAHPAFIPSRTCL